MSEEIKTLMKVEVVGNDPNLNTLREIPNSAALENATTAGKIMIGLLPIIGSTLSEILGKTTSLVISARETKWKEAVVSAFEEVFEKVEGISNPELILKDDRFVTALLNATQIATRTHKEEKLEALRNAVLNAALPGAPDDDLEMLFLNFIDTFTAAHLKFLAVFNNPERWFKSLNFDSDNIFDFSKLGISLTFSHQIYVDLINRGLLDRTSRGDLRYSVKFEDYDRVAPILSDLGRQFLTFITSPLTKTIKKR